VVLWVENNQLIDELVKTAAHLREAAVIEHTKVASENGTPITQGDLASHLINGMCEALGIDK
jgi:hypothetical protein